MQISCTSNASNASNADRLEVCSQVVHAPKERKYHQIPHSHTQPQSLVPQMLALISAFVVASSYVISIHTFKPNITDRNNIAVIKARFRNVSIMCLAWLMVAPFLVAELRQIGPWQALAALRLVPTSWHDIYMCGYCFVSALVLYSGPISDEVLSGQFTVEDFGTIFGFRDLVFAPVTEELIYRAVIDTILTSRYSTKAVTFGSPLLFGVAHIHHGYALLRDHRPVAEVVVGVLFQTLYTTLFGTVANVIYMEKGSFWGGVLVHGVCNMMGIPGGPERIGGVYYGMLVGGLGGFWYMIFS